MTAPLPGGPLRRGRLLLWALPTALFMMMVMHLVSRVEGRLAEGRDAVDAIRACLNVGTL